MSFYTLKYQNLKQVEMLPKIELDRLQQQLSGGVL